nr:hypothetical protein [Dickeya dadantii]
MQFKPIDLTRYEQDVQAVDAGSFSLRIRPVTFELDKFLADPTGYKHYLQEVLYAGI